MSSLSFSSSFSPLCPTSQWDRISRATFHEHQGMQPRWMLHRHPQCHGKRKLFVHSFHFSGRASIWRLCTCSGYPWQMRHALILIEWCFHNRMGVQRSWHTLWMLSWVPRSGEGRLLRKVHGKTTRPGLPSYILRIFEEVGFFFFLKCLGSSLKNPIRYLRKSKMCRVQKAFHEYLKAGNSGAPSPVSLIWVLSPQSGAGNWWGHSCWLNSWKFVLSHQCKCCPPNLYMCTN